MNRSESIKEITTSMIRVQEEIKGMTPDAKNPFFKSNYITLDGILEYVRPILTKNGVWVIQEAKGLEMNIGVKTTLCHTSGEYMETETLEMTLPKNDPQALGSVVTYLKRYQLAALLGISSEVDDDGNKATDPKPKYTQKPEQKPATKPQNTQTDTVITTAQAKRLFAMSGGNESIVRSALSKYGYEHSKDVKVSDYEKVVLEVQTAVKGSKGA